MDIDFNVVIYTLGIYLAIVVSPGPNFALVSRLALQGKSKATQGAIIGLAIAATFYAVLAMLGLSEILSNFGWAVRLFQVAGGLYLIYLGIDSWRSNDAGNSNVSEQSNLAGELDSLIHGFKIGAIVNLSNPKGIAFFVGLYAVAVPIDASISTRIAVLVGGVILELVWYSFVARLLSGLHVRKLYESAKIHIDRAIGSVLILLGLKMIANNET